MPNAAKLVDVIIPCKDSVSALDSCVGAVAGQEIGGNWSLEIIIVDDGSRVPVVAESFKLMSLPVTVLRNDKSQGRSSAINYGLRSSSADYCWVIDADCILQNKWCFSRVVQWLTTGVDVCFGRTVDAGEGFWSEYHGSVAKARLAKKSINDLTTACFVARRSSLIEVGGFNQDYCQYGFEDRDLVATLVERYGKNNMVVEPELIAVHEDKPDLMGVMNKFKQAGKYSSAIFFQRYPDVYKELSYSHFDAATITTFRKLVLTLIAPLVMLIAPLLKGSLEKPILPFAMKKVLVQAVCAMSFFTGSKDRE